MFYKDDNGEYSYHSFSMYIESDRPVAELVDPNNSTFIHEYMHFLQNISFPYLIRPTIAACHRIGLLFNDIGTNLKYPRPFKYDDIYMLDFDEELNITLGKYQECSFDLNKLKSIKQNIAYKKKLTKDETRIFEYILNFSTNEEDEDTGIKREFNYIIGAMDLLEYISYKIENKFFNTKLPIFPYKTVDYIFKYYNISNIPEKIKLLLVEYALYNDNPVSHLIDTIEALKSKKELLFSYYRLEELLKKSYWETKATGKDTIFTKSKRRFEQIQETISEIFKEEHFKYINEWIYNIIEYSRKNFANKFIFSKLYSMKKNDFCKYINSLIYNIGIPLVMNKQYQCVNKLPIYMNNSEDAYNEFLSFYIIERLMISLEKNKNKECPMIEWCKGNNIETTNDCFNNPYTKINMLDLKYGVEYKVCPFVYFIYKFHLLKVKW